MPAQIAVAGGDARPPAAIAWAVLLPGAAHRLGTVIPGSDFEQGHDGLRRQHPAAESQCLDWSQGGGFGELQPRRFRGRQGFGPYWRSQPLQHPSRERELGRAIRPADRRAIHLTQHRVHEAGGGSLMRALDQLHAFGDRGVRRNTVEIAQLKNAHSRSAMRPSRSSLGCRASGEMADQKIELALVPERAISTKVSAKAASRESKARRFRGASRSRSIATPTLDFSQDPERRFLDAAETASVTWLRSA